MWIGLLIGLGLIIFGGFFLYLENKNEGPTFRLFNVILDFNPWEPGPGCLFVVGILIVIVVFISFIIKLI